MLDYLYNETRIYSSFVQIYMFMMLYDVLHHFKILEKDSHFNNIKK